MATNILIGEPAQSLAGIDFLVSWDGLEDMLSSFETKTPNNKLATRNMYQDTKTFCDKYRNMQGDPAKGNAIKAYVERLKDARPALFRKDEEHPERVWADNGASLGIHRYLGGDERCYRRRKRKHGPAKCIRMMAEISATGWSSDAEQVARVGSIVAMGEWLLEQGYTVEILASDFSKDFLTGSWTCGGTELATVVVKCAEEEFDPAKLVTVLGGWDFGYNALLRATVNACPKVPARHWGRVIDVPETAKNALGIDVSCPKRVQTESDSLAWLDREVARLTE